jgi:hypothetical protein
VYSLSAGSEATSSDTYALICASPSDDQRALLVSAPASSYFGRSVVVDESTSTPHHVRRGDTNTIKQASHSVSRQLTLLIGAPLENRHYSSSSAPPIDGTSAPRSCHQSAMGARPLTPPSTGDDDRLPLDTEGNVGAVYRLSLAFEEVSPSGDDAQQQSSDGPSEGGVSVPAWAGASLLLLLSFIVLALAISHRVKKFIRRRQRKERSQGYAVVSASQHLV